MLDMDADGDLDILYRNGSTGQLMGWEMENGAQVGSFSLTNPGSGWVPRF